MWAAHQREDCPVALLRCLDTPDTVWPLATQTSLGRADDNTIIVDDEFVSAHHAVLTCKEGVWWLTDLNSTNGTSVNDESFIQSVALSCGDVIKLGNMKYRLE